MLTMRRRLTLGLGGAVVALGAVVSFSAAPAQTTQCSLGQAANYSVFANGDVITGGTTTAGGIAAAGDVQAGSSGGGISIGRTPSAPFAVVAGENFTGTNGSLDGGVSAGGTITLNSFGVTGAQEPSTPPPFSFREEFERLSLLSASLAEESSTGTVVLQSWARSS